VDPVAADGDAVARRAAAHLEPVAEQAAVRRVARVRPRAAP